MEVRRRTGLADLLSPVQNTDRHEDVSVLSTEKKGED